MRLIAPLLLISVAIACSSSSAPAGPNTAAINAACSDQAKAQCNKRDSCSQGSFLNKVVYGDEATCESRLLQPCVSALSAKGTAQTPARIESCVSQYSGVSCTDFLDGNPSGDCVPPNGALANGSACGASGQCTSSHCAITQNQVCGTCAALPIAGAACLSVIDCGRDLACAIPNGATAGTCAAFAQSGGACLSGTSPCAAGLACVGDDEANKTMGKCAPTATTVGAACDALRKTIANCAGALGLACIPTAKGSSVGTCQAITLVEPGATCGIVGLNPITGFTECHAGAACIKVAATDLTGKCVSPAADGAACDSDVTKGPPCLAPSRCVPSASTGTAGVCTTPNATKCL